MSVVPLFVTVMVSSCHCVIVSHSHTDCGLLEPRRTPPLHSSVGAAWFGLEWRLGGRRGLSLHGGDLQSHH